MSIIYIYIYIRIQCIMNMAVTSPISICIYVFTYWNTMNSEHGSLSPMYIYVYIFVLYQDTRIMNMAVMSPINILVHVLWAAPLSECVRTQPQKIFQTRSSLSKALRCVWGSSKAFSSYYSTQSIN